MPRKAAKTAGRVVAGIELLTAAELADQIGCSTKTIHRYRRQRELRPTYVAGRLFFDTREVRRWLDSLKGAPHPSTPKRATVKASDL